MEKNDAFAQEWGILQALHERYEFGALAIKLLAVLLFFAAAMFGLQGEWLAVMVVLLWLQEGIFKTSQTRLGARLLTLEQLIAQDQSAAGLAFQLHSSWLASRPGTLGLLAEYARSALRPTVAFPYAPLLLLALWWLD